MDLGRLVFKNVNGSDIKRFVEALDELPDGTIHGVAENVRIEVHSNPQNSGVLLEVPFRSENDGGNIGFYIPMGASLVDQDKYVSRLSFRYNGINYLLTKFFHETVSIQTS